MRRSLLQFQVIGRGYTSRRCLDLRHVLQLWFSMVVSAVWWHWKELQRRSGPWPRLLDRTTRFESGPGLTYYVLRVAKPAAVLPEHGEDEMFRAVETLKQFLLREHPDLVAANEHMALLCTCGSDCTPLRTNETVRASTGELSVAFAAEVDPALVSGIAKASSPSCSTTLSAWRRSLLGRAFSNAGAITLARRPTEHLIQ